MLDIDLYILDPSGAESCIKILIYFVVNSVDDARVISGQLHLLKNLFTNSIHSIAVILDTKCA